MIRSRAFALAALVTAAVFVAPAAAGLFSGGSLDLPKGRFIDETEPRRSDMKAIPGAYQIPFRADTDGAVFPPNAVQRYLESIAERLIAQWPHEAPAVSVRVSTQFFPPADYHAVATPDDAVILYMGVLEDAETEDEVAFVLAHEIAHVLLGHMTRDKYLNEVRRTAKVASQLGRLTATASAVAVTGHRSGAGARVDEPKAAERRAKAAQIYDDFSGVLDQVISPYWTRRLEDEADLLAIDLMTAAGYAPAYAEFVFLRLEEAQAARQDRFKNLMAGYEEFVQGLPPEFMAETALGVAQGSASVEAIGADALKKIRRDVIATARSSVLDWLEPDHRDPDKRNEGLVEYIEREYADAMDRDPQEAAIEEIRASPDFASLVAARASIIEGRASLRSYDIARGLAQIAPATSGAFASYDEGRWLKHRLRFTQGNASDARKNLELATGSSQTGVRTYEKLFAFHWGAGERTTALGRIAEAERRYGDRDHFLPERIFAAVQQGQSAQSLMSQCQALVKLYLHPICSAAAKATTADFRDRYAAINCAPDPTAASRQPSGNAGPLGGLLGDVLGSGRGVVDTLIEGDC